MAEEGGKTQQIVLSEGEKLGLVVRLLFHQDKINWHGFDIGTGHSLVAAKGILERMKKQFVKIRQNSASTKEEDDVKKVKDRKGAAAKSAVSGGEEGDEPKQALKKKKAAKKEKKMAEADEEGEPVEEVTVKKKRERKPSKKATKTTGTSKSQNKTLAPDAPTEEKGKKRSKSKTPGAEPAGKKAKTNVEA